MRKSKLTPDEVAELLSKPFEIFPEPSEDAKAKGITKRGPSGWQKSAFMWEYPWDKRLANYLGMHTHFLDNTLAYGGFSGGKTQLGVALNLFFLTSFPGCETLVGAEHYNDVESIVIPKFKKLLSIKSDWDHVYVTHIPNKQDKYLDLTIPVFDENGNFAGHKTSRAWFMHFSDWERLRGREYSMIHFEEISQLKEERVVDELNRRLRSPLAPFRMMYCTTNPPESRSHWMYTKWDLSKFDPGYQGEKPEVKACKCQFCQDCLNDKDSPGQFPYEEDGTCSNPNCSFLKFCKANNLPLSRSKRPSCVFRGKNYSCVGDQAFWRVLHSTALDNPHIPPDLMQSIKVGHDEANFAVYAMGEVRELRSNKCYSSYSFSANVNLNNLAVDPTKDIHWTHDHNTRPRCSVIIQEYPAEDDQVVVQCIDEIIKYDTKEPKLNEDGERIRGVGPEHVALDFIQKYTYWNDASKQSEGGQKTVYLHGDHTALNSKMSPFSANEFQVYYNMLTEAGFKVVVAVKKIKGQTQIRVTDRIICTNWMLRDDKGNIRVKVNKECRHLIKSLEDVEWKDDKSTLNKQCDEYAAKATNTKIVHLLSHPTDALGYYLVRKFNLIKEMDSFRFIYVPGAGMGTIDKDNKIITSNEPEKPKESPLALIDYIRGYTGEEDQSSFDQFRSFYN